MRFWCSEERTINFKKKKNKQVRKHYPTYFATNTLEIGFNHIWDKMVLILKIKKNKMTNMNGTVPILLAPIKDLGFPTSYIAV